MHKVQLRKDLLFGQLGQCLHKEKNHICIITCNHLSQKNCTCFVQNLEGLEGISQFLD